jgi:hypothetical protein
MNNGIRASRRSLCGALVMGALPPLSLRFGLRLAAAQPGGPSMPRPLVPLFTMVDQWDHHWFLWLPHHGSYEAVEVASREPDHDGRVAVWVWFTERAGKKRQIHYRNDPQLANFVGGNYRPIDYGISGEDARPRGLKVRFDDIEGERVEIDVAFDPGQTLNRRGAGLTDQSGHMSDRAFLIFYRDMNALAQDARVSVAGQNVTFDRDEPMGQFRFKWAYSHHITIGLIQYGSFKVTFGPGGFMPLETGGYAQRRPCGGRVALLSDSDGQLTEYVDRGAAGGLLRVVFDPPLPACSGRAMRVSSEFSISIGAAADVVKGRVETLCGDDADVLAWQPSEPMWASKQPYRSEVSRADEHSLLIAVAPVP